MIKLLFVQSGQNCTSKYVFYFVDSNLYFTGDALVKILQGMTFKPSFLSYLRKNGFLISPTYFVTEVKLNESSKRLLTIWKNKYGD